MSSRLPGQFSETRSYEEVKGEGWDHSLMTDLMLSMCSGACFNPQVKEGGFGQVFYKRCLLGLKTPFNEICSPHPFISSWDS